MSLDKAFDDACHQWDAEKPWTYKLPGHEPDVLLTVFGKPLYAHSMVLKMHSAFFRRLMDLPSPPEQNGSQIRYEYVTVVDDDDFWALEKVSFVHI